MRIWYARVSTTGQSLNVQLDKLTKAGAEKVFHEKKTWATRDEREALAAALDFVREGDVFIVTKLDRLARSVLDLTAIVQKLSVKMVDLLVTDQAIDTTTPTGRLMLHVLAALAEFERELIKERAADGIARAKAAGVHFGREAKLTPEEIALLKAQFHEGHSRPELARKFGISRASVYRICGADAADSPMLSSYDTPPHDDR